MNIQDLNPSDLADRRNQILDHFAKIDGEFDRRRGENRLLVKAEDIRWESKLQAKQGEG